MMLILIAYYNYFVMEKKCAFLLAELDGKVADLLSIKAEELSSFKFVCNGPSDFRDEVDSIPFLFSIHSKGWDHTLAHVMINCLAISLGMKLCYCNLIGSPPKSNFLYPRIFQIEKLSGAFIPGSDYNNVNFDCGFTTLESNDKKGSFILTNRLNIMNNNRIYRLALNVMIWTTSAFSCSLDPAGNTPKQIACSHWLNYTDDTQLQFRNANDRNRVLNTNEKARSYMMQRAGV